MPAHAFTCAGIFFLLIYFTAEMPIAPRFSIKDVNALRGGYALMTGNALRQSAYLGASFAPLSCEEVNNLIFRKQSLFVEEGQGKNFVPYVFFQHADNRLYAQLHSAVNKRV